MVVRWGYLCDHTQIISKYNVYTLKLKYTQRMFDIYDFASMIFCFNNFNVHKE